MRRVALCLVLIVNVAASLIAQESPSAAIVVFAEGDAITLIRDSQLARFDAFQILGEPLYAGDQLSTENGTYVEIQLLGSRSIVKVSENTTLTIAELSGAGESLIDVAYGRVRSRIEQLSGTQRFEVRGLTAVAGVRGTEFGFDQLIDPVSGGVVGRIYTFDGAVEVFPRGDDAPAPALVEAGEMVTLDSAAPAAAIATVTAIPESVTQAWVGREIQSGYRETNELVRDFPSLVPILGGSEAQSEGDGMPSPDLEVAALPDEGSESSLETDEVDQPTTEEPFEEEGEPSVEVAEVDEQEVPADEVEVAEELPEEAGTASVLRTTGLIVTGAGLATDLVAAGLYFFGDNSDAVGPVAIGGLAGIAAGIITILISNFL